MFRKALRAALALSAITAPFAACSSEQPEQIITDPVESCHTAADCDWGEIDHEIAAASDCPCLYGCGYIPLSRAAINRRKSQYAALCSPDHDGKGNACGVDDCAVPGPLACVAGQCAADRDAH
jgi:hypothetical protein